MKSVSKDAQRVTLHVQALNQKIIRMCREMMKYVSKDARRVTLLRHKLQAAEVWADRRKLSAQARLKIRAFYADVWMGHAGITSSPTFSAPFSTFPINGPQLNAN